MAHCIVDETQSSITASSADAVGGISGTAVSSAITTTGNLILKNIGSVQCTDGGGTGANATEYAVAACGAFTSSGGGATNGQMSITVQTKGNPVLLLFGATISNGTASIQSTGFIGIFRDGTQLFAPKQVFCGGNSALNAVCYTPCSLAFVDVVAAGTYTYDVRCKGGTSSVPLFVADGKFQLIELG